MVEVGLGARWKVRSRYHLLGSLFGGSKREKFLLMGQIWSQYAGHKQSKLGCGSKIR